MGRVTALLAARRTLHLDWLDYATALFAGGRLDWSDAEAVATLYGKAQALLPSDLIVVPFDRIFAARLGAHSAPRAAMAVRPNGAQPLRALLGDAGLRATTAEVMARIGRATTPALLALAVADPASLARRAAALAGVTEPDADEDLADDAAVYLADALRGLADTGIAAVVIVDPEPRFGMFLAPVRKVAAHYGWDVGVRGVGDGFDFAMAPRPLDTTMPGAVLDSVVVPAGMAPEAVLAAVVALREMP